MNFKYKCFLQKLFSKMKNGDKCNYFFQKHISKSMPISEQKFLEEYNKKCLQHINIYHQYGNGKELSNCAYYEFGAGWDLLSVLGMSICGIKSADVIDIKPLMQPEEILWVLSLYKQYASQFHLENKWFPSELEVFIPQKDENFFVDYLREYFRITYKAPADARKTEFESGSFDFVVSNVTMEHIPKEDLRKILAESERIMKNGAIMSVTIDYCDHWSYFDHSIGVYNYLRYSEKEWKKYNPDLHYQNRLRHSDYIALMEESGLELIKAEAAPITKAMREQLALVEVDPFFKKYDFEDLLITGGSFVLKK
ncbi:MAG: methyltransferase domain-containing protein [Christensenellaceae bacterium]